MANRGNIMSELAILQPVLVLITLTAIVWLVMLVTRTRQFSQPEYRDLNPDTREKVAKALTGRAELSSNNFNNLFELPVLFYALVFVILHLALVDNLHVWLAWIFVIFRILHSLVHCTYNNVLHRFLLWLVSTLALLVMLVRVLPQMF